MEKPICKHVIVSGLVQGVCYRAFVQDNARSLRVFGWVKNLPDSRVEAELEGEESAVNDLIEFMRQGPRAAHVTNLEIEIRAFQNQYNSFSVRYH
jgi:acylphosphatase